MMLAGTPTPFADSKAAYCSSADGMSPRSTASIANPNLETIETIGVTRGEERTASAASSATSSWSIRPVIRATNGINKAVHEES